MNKDQIIEAVNEGKKVYVNGFEWFVKKMEDVVTDEQYQIVSNIDGTIFCPLLNNKGGLVLQGATFVLSRF